MNKKIDNYSIMIASKYFNSIDDFINLEMAVKRSRGNMERFHFNPIPLNDTSRQFFPNLETIHLYNETDQKYNDGRIFKYCIWYEVDYETFIDEKFQGNDCKLISYTKGNRIEYGNKIPNEIQIVGDNCFSNCYSLKSIEIPKSVRKLGNYCFSNCTSLSSITIPDSVSYLGDYCFNNCISLTSIVIPASITHFGKSCFYGCERLKNNPNIPKKCFCSDVAAGFMDFQSENEHDDQDYLQFYSSPNCENESESSEEYDNCSEGYGDPCQDYHLEEKYYEEENQNCFDDGYYEEPNDGYGDDGYYGNCDECYDNGYCDDGYGDDGYCDDGYGDDGYGDDGY